MKKKHILIIGLVLLMAIGLPFLLNRESKSFYLDDIYYTNADLILMEQNELLQLEKDQASFVVVVEQPTCSTFVDFNDVINDFIEKHELTFYQTFSFSIEDTQIENKVDYFPSVVIYQEGKIVDYLDANSDEHTTNYKSLSDFENWISKTIYLTKEF